MEHIEKNLSINSIKFLRQLNEVVSDVTALKCSYMEKCAKKLSQSDLQLPSKITACPKCQLVQSVSTVEYRIGKKSLRNKLLRKISKKEEHGKKLVKFEQEYLEKNRKKTKNRLVKVCKICKNRSEHLLPMTKEPAVNRSKALAQTPTTEVSKNVINVRSKIKPTKFQIRITEQKKQKKNEKANKKLQNILSMNTKNNSISLKDFLQSVCV